MQGLEMTAEKAARWVLEFGRDWVHTNILRGTWADAHLYWTDEAHGGYLEMRSLSEYGEDYIKITEKAIALI